MKDNASTHERLADRLANILTKLNIGHQLSVQELAREFQVSTRTIERDFVRLNAYLPLIQDENTKRYYLEPSYLGRFKLQDIQNFAQLSGISELYPALDMSLFVNCWMSGQIRYFRQKAIILKMPNSLPSISSCLQGRFINGSRLSCNIPIKHESSSHTG